MRFNCGPDFATRWERRKALLESWHEHFALLPVRVGETCVWLEKVRRRGVYHQASGIRRTHCWWVWEYELL